MSQSYLARTLVPQFPMPFATCQVYSTRLAGALGLEHDEGGEGGAGRGRDSGLDGSETVLPTLSNEVRVERHFEITVLLSHN